MAKELAGPCYLTPNSGFSKKALPCGKQRGRIAARVKHWKTALSIFALSAYLALAEDFKTINGREYKNATVSHIEADGIVLKTKSGISKVYFVELPKDVQKRFGYDTDKIAAEQAAAKAAEDKHIEKEKAGEREREETEKRAVADLDRAREQFLAAEQRATESYRSATKGTVSGQIFVSTKGGENFKLGAVQVGLFARDAIDAILPALKKYADVKIEQLKKPVAEARAVMEQATASGDDFVSKLEKYNEINADLTFYYSGGFYISYFQSPIQSAETDADGKFTIQLSKTGAFVIAAHAKRSVGNITEHYYWLQPVSLDGQQQLTQNLSNNNLTSTTGTSSLIHTKD